MSTNFQSGVISDYEKISRQLNLWFSAKGYSETISYSFVDPEIQEVLYPQSSFMQLLNPISSELSQMRAGMWPGLIASMIYNAHRQQNAIKFFETGVVFDVQEQQVKERHCVAGLMMGLQNNLSWNTDSRSFDFFDLKGDLESLFASLKIPDVQFSLAAHEALHLGKALRL